MSRILLLIAVVFFMLVYLLLQQYSVPSIFWFVGIGVIMGIYYGVFNNSIFHQSAKFNNEFEKVQALWIHLICSITSFIGMYLLFNKFISTSSVFGLGDFALLVYVILGVSGLLPRTFWFLANSGSLRP